VLLRPTRTHPTTRRTRHAHQPLVITSSRQPSACWHVMADGNGYATAPDIAHLLGITTTLVYVWAHRDHWHRTRTRPRRYRLEDAHQSWDKRHPQHQDQGPCARP